MTDYAALRQRMVDEQIEARGVRSSNVLEAMRTVPRELFVPSGQQIVAYEDTPLPIGEGQTISQPYIVAFMVDALELSGDERVLDVGTGSGYAAAVLAEIVSEVFSIERVGELAERARRTLTSLGYGNVAVRHGDGALGWPEAAPFDAIVVAAGSPDVPEYLKRQLKIGGRLVIPVGGTLSFQVLIRITRVTENEFSQEDLIPVRFVPLISEKSGRAHR